MFGRLRQSGALRLLLMVHCCLQKGKSYFQTERSDKHAHMTLERTQSTKVCAAMHLCHASLKPQCKPSAC